MKILSVTDVAELITEHGLDKCIAELIARLRSDFARWDEFTKMPRPAMHVADGVIELMPICDKEYYSFKYVNGHPKNPTHGKQTVMATGQLSRVADGEPLLFSEMNLLTALRTAATSALATDLMARKDAQTVAIIGTGAQSEFQIRALQQVRPITEVYYFDTDPEAMEKFTRNMQTAGIRLTPASTAAAAVHNADIVTVCTACKDHVAVINNAWVKPGMHLNGLGGDCPGKTELDAQILPRANVVVEYFEQSFIEGEIQRLSEPDARKLVHAELHELVTNAKTARTSDEDITVFDSVGIALEDYSVLRWVYELAERQNCGEDLQLIPELKDPKDLFVLLEKPAEPVVQKVAAPRSQMLH
jgi:ornithine cyclodeaminase